MDEVKEGLRYLFQTRSEVVCCVSGTGHAGMETTICNLLEPNDVILIAQNGIWGERAADMACRHGKENIALMIQGLGNSIHLILCLRKLYSDSYLMLQVTIFSS